MRCRRHIRHLHTFPLSFYLMHCFKRNTYSRAVRDDYPTGYACRQRQWAEWGDVLKLMADYCQAEQTWARISLSVSKFSNNCSTVQRCNGKSLAIQCNENCHAGGFHGTNFWLHDLLQVHTVSTLLGILNIIVRGYEMSTSKAWHGSV